MATRNCVAIREKKTKRCQSFNESDIQVYRFSINARQLTIVTIFLFCICIILFINKLGTQLSYYVEWLDDAIWPFCTYN